MASCQPAVSLPRLTCGTSALEAVTGAGEGGLCDLQAELDDFGGVACISSLHPLVLYGQLALKSVLCARSQSLR